MLGPPRANDRRCHSRVAQHPSDSQLADVADSQRVKDIRNYIVKGVLWQAFDADEPCVLLIDEVDRVERALEGMRVGKLSGALRKIVEVPGAVGNLVADVDQLARREPA